MKKTLLGCMAIIIAGVFLNSDYNILLKTLGIILIIVVTKLFEGECCEYGNEYDDDNGYNK
jgi:hypothetical protein